MMPHPFLHFTMSSWNILVNMDWTPMDNSVNTPIKQKAVELRVEYNLVQKRPVMLEIQHPSGC